jgi:hypothetical protein
MRHSQPDALTLLVSGYPDVQSAMAAILLEADEIIVKPFEAGKLAELLRDKMLTRKPAARMEKERLAAILQRCTAGVVRDCGAVLRLRWATAPHLRQMPDQTSRPDRTDAVRPVIAPNDDIVGWPDELLIDFPDFPDCTLDTVANTPTPDSYLHPCLSKTTNGESSLLAVIDRGGKYTHLPFQS